MASCIPRTKNSRPFATRCVPRIRRRGGFRGISCGLCGTRCLLFILPFLVARGTRYALLVCLLATLTNKCVAEPLARSGEIEGLLGLVDARTIEQRLLELDGHFEDGPANLDRWLSSDEVDNLRGRLVDDSSSSDDSVYQYQALPAGLLYRSYLAGEKEPRMKWSALYDIKRERTIWETSLGGRVGLLRYGTQGSIAPQGYQLDFEGAVFARLIPSEPSTMLEGADFRFGLLNTWRKNRLAVKLGYYHVSAHLGDEFLLVNPDYDRINYVRDAAIVGLTVDVVKDTQVYGEVANAIGSQGGAKPWEFQFGTQYVPTTQVSARGSPYLGANTYLRQDFAFRGGLNLIAGWNWYGEKTGDRLRIGMQYYRGPSLQYSFFDRRERLIGGGVWYDY